MTGADFLNRATRMLFFTGKGGVGKTSLACATAAGLAQRGRRVLLVSTDPASNLDIDPEASAKAYRERVVGPYRGVLPEAAVESMEEQLSGACTVEIAAFDEFTKWLGDDSATLEFDHLIFDTAPTGHTLRLLKLPGAWTGFMATNTTGTSSADRTQGELAQIGVLNQCVILNGLFVTREPNDPFAGALEARGRQAVEGMPAALAALPRLEVPLLPYAPMGIQKLHGMLGDAQVEREAPHHPDVDLAALVSPLSELIDEIERAGRGVVMTMGKGAVGKTTVASAIAIELAHRGHRVRLSTTDPAAHLAATIGKTVPGLQVSRIDPAVETELYREEVKAKAAPYLDAEGQALLDEDLRSPCTEEIAVFRAFAQTVAGDGTFRIVTS